MKRFLILFAALLLVSGLCGAAYATPYFTETVATTSNVNGSSGLTSPFLTTPGINVQNFDSTTLPAGWTGNGQVVINTNPGLNAAPYGDGTNYLTVPTDVTQSPKSVTFTLGNNNYNYVGLYWGSVDTYNSLQILETNGQTCTLGGVDGLGLKLSGGNQGPGGSEYVDIFGLSGIESITFTSSQYAFELDNLAYGNVPEPCTLLFLGAGLAGLGIYRRKSSMK